MTSSMTRAATALIVIMVVLVGASCAVTKVGGADESTTFGLSGESIVIRSDFGFVELVPVAPTGGPGHEVKVTRRFEVSKTAGEAHAEWAKEGEDTIRLGGVCSGVIIDCRLRHRVEVPNDVAVEVRAESGSVRADGFTAPLQIKVDEGNINIDRASGPLELSSANGSMRAENLTSDQVRAKATDGYLILEFAEPAAQVETRSTRGNSTLRVPADRYRIRTDLSRAQSSVTIDRDSGSAHRIDAAVTDGRLLIERN